MAAVPDYVLMPPSREIADAQREEEKCLGYVSGVAQAEQLLRRALSPIPVVRETRGRNQPHPEEEKEHPDITRGEAEHPSRKETRLERVHEVFVRQFRVPTPSARGAKLAELARQRMLQARAQCTLPTTEDVEQWVEKATEVVQDIPSSPSPPLSPTAQEVPQVPPTVLEVLRARLRDLRVTTRTVRRFRPRGHQDRRLEEIQQDIEDAFIEQFGTPRTVHFYQGKAVLFCDVAEEWAAMEWTKRTATSASSPCPPQQMLLLLSSLKDKPPRHQETLLRTFVKQHAGQTLSVKWLLHFIPLLRD